MKVFGGREAHSLPVYTLTNESRVAAQRLILYTSR